MKLWIKLLLTGIGAFGGGFAAGFFTRKKFCEVQIEEISEEELNSLAGAETKSEEEPEVVADIPKIEKEKQQDTLNTQKEAYFRKWKADDALAQYDTRTAEEPKDVMALGEEDLRIDDDDLETDVTMEGTAPPAKPSSKFVPATFEDWRKALNAQDGEFDCIELTWYSQDDVICDDNDSPLENSKDFVTIDLPEAFDKPADDVDGDPDVRIFLNRAHRAIYYINRVDASYRLKKRQEEFGEDGYEDDIYDRFHR